MGLNIELTYIFIQLQIRLMLTKHCFINKKYSSSDEGICTQLPCKTKDEQKRIQVCVSERYVCLSV